MPGQSSISVTGHTEAALSATIDLRRHLRQHVGPTYKFQPGPDDFGSRKVGVCLFPPDERKPYWTVCSVGMSGILMQSAPLGSRNIELLISLPEDWNWNDPLNSWPLTLMWTMVDLISTDPGKAIVYGQSVRAKGATIPIFSSTDRPAGGILFGRPELLTEAAWRIDSDEMKARWLSIIPLFVEEIVFVEKHGERALIERLEESSVTEFFDRRRLNTCTGKDFVGSQSERLVDEARRISELVHIPMQWVRATRHSIMHQVAFDVSLVAGYVGSRQAANSLTSSQCLLLGDISAGMESDYEDDAEKRRDDYLTSFASSWKTLKPRLPSVRLAIFRKSDIGFGTAYAEQYRKFLLDVAKGFLNLSESLSEAQQANCLDEISIVLSQHSTGLVAASCEIDGRIELAESLQSKIAKLSLAALNNLDLSPEFIWLDKREVAIEYLLRTLAVEVIALNDSNKGARLKFLESIAPCIAIFGDDLARRDGIIKLLARFNLAGSEVPEPAKYTDESPEPGHDGEFQEDLEPSTWVELIAFSNRTDDRELQTLALRLLFQFGSELLNVATDLNKDELNWRSTVLEALAEAALRSEQVLLD